MLRSLAWGCAGALRGPGARRPACLANVRAINFVAELGDPGGRTTTVPIAPPNVYYRGHHVVLDITNAVIHGGFEEIDTMGRNLLDAMAGAARKEGANVLMTHIEVFDGEGSPPGFASVCLLDESHISAHCYSTTGLLAIDAFTCGEDPSCTERGHLLLLCHGSRLGLIFVVRQPRLAPCVLAGRTSHR